MTALSARLRLVKKPAMRPDGCVDARPPWRAPSGRRAGLKQLLGFGDSQARTQRAVERTAPFVGLLFTLTVL
jgi:hypothetical protein